MEFQLLPELKSIDVHVRAYACSKPLIRAVCVYNELFMMCHSVGPQDSATIECADKGHLLNPIGPVELTVESFRDDKHIIEEDLMITINN